MILAGGQQYGWDIDPGKLATIWRGGCIIRARFLDRIREAYDADPKLPSLLVDPYFAGIIEAGEAAWRRVVAHAVTVGHPGTGLRRRPGPPRRAAPRPAAGRAPAGAARPLRRAHLPARGPGGRVPHAVVR